jgi:EF-P beta-lysylation protein EpmB
MKNMAKNHSIGARPAPVHRAPAWQQEMARAFTNAPALLTALGLDPAREILPAEALKRFPLRVPRSFVSRMQYGDPEDPLLRQVLPVADEAIVAAGYGPDPVGDTDSTRGPGMLQKYHGRALLIVTGACAINCRYCFRREFSYADNSLTGSALDAALAQIRSDTTLQEIILSGGDPLSISDARLESLLAQLADIEHVRRIRFHTRLPVVLPERIDKSFLDVLSRIEKPMTFVIHCNHANEIDDNVARAIGKISQRCSPILNQSVLLRGINDSVSALTNLSETLFQIGVLPYYLHQLDPVQGASHFEISDKTARKLVGKVARKLPGYLVPRLVREVPGAPAKLILSPTLHNNGQLTT